MYSSPVHKLASFFRKSRDGWKAKYMQAKRDNKRLTNQTRAVERSRKHWKQVAQAANAQARSLERELQELKCSVVG